MTTSEAQFEADRIIPASATSPGITEDGEFDQLTEGLRRDLSPQGTLEGIFAAEITRAARRLRRCDNLEAASETTFSEQLQTAVDRARAETHRLLKRSLDELRRLQNERRFRVEVLPAGFNVDDLGLTSYKELMPAMATEKRWQLLKRQLEGPGIFEQSDASFERKLAATVGPPQSSPNASEYAPKADSTNQTQSTETRSAKRTHLLPNTPAQTPRNAPCPCGSGEKHKRCCGRNAAPVLYSAAA